MFLLLLFFSFLLLVPYYLLLCGVVIYNVVCCEEVEAKGSTIAVRQGNTDTREKYIKGTGKLIKRSMKLSTLLIISAIVAAFGS